MTNKQIIVALVIVLVLVLVGFAITYILLTNHIRKKNQYAVFITKKKVKSNKLYMLYEYLSQNVLTKRQVKKIKIRHDIIFPGDERRAATETVKVILAVWISGLFVGFYILLNKVGLYGSALAFLMLYVIQNEIINGFVEKKEIKLLGYLEKYINEVRKHYFDYGMVESAIYEANETAQYEMRLHGQKIYEVITSEEKEEDTLLYNEQIPNRFLRILLAICSTTVDFGDKKMPNDETVFLFNLKELGKEITIEKLKREKKANVFMGTTFLSMIPIFSIPFIEQWAISNVEELYTWYNGLQGIVVLCLIFLTTVGIYNVLNILKGTINVDDSVHVVLSKIAGLPFVSQILNNLVQSNYGQTLRTQDMLKHSGSNMTIKEYYVKRLLTGIGFFVLGLIVIFTAHSSVKQLQLEYVDNVTNITSSTDERENEELKRLTKLYTNQYKNEKVEKKALVASMKKNTKIIKNDYVLELIADEVIQRIEIYQSQYVKWYEMLIVIAMSIVGYMFPQWGMILKQKFVQMQMEDEVIQFQSIILMLIYLDRISTQTILSWMENFAVVFKDSIQKCLADWSHGDQEALENLKEEEPFGPFVRIIENLQQADKVGIRKAFNEIAVDRQNYQEKRKQENEIMLHNRGVIANFIAMIPLSVTITLYLVYPFISSGLQMLMNMNNDINGMM